MAGRLLNSFTGNGITQRELSDVVEAAGYRLDEAKIERDEDSKATNRILLAIYPFKALERLEKKGDA
jgi:predicted Ser/Thr protein kinase